MENHSDCSLVTSIHTHRQTHTTIHLTNGWVWRSARGFSFATAYQENVSELASFLCPLSSGQTGIFSSPRTFYQFSYASEKREKSLLFRKIVQQLLSTNASDFNNVSILFLISFEDNKGFHCTL